MGMILARLPYNRAAACDVAAAVAALRTGRSPAAARRTARPLNVSCCE
jgi:hypothetical protein